MSLSDVGFLAVLLVQGSKHPHGPVTGYLVASATPDDLVRLGPGPESFSGEDDCGQWLHVETNHKFATGSNFRSLKKKSQDQNRK
jgi:hypothetical protein